MSTPKILDGTGRLDLMADLLPIPDRDNGPYFAGLARGELHLQHCEDCGKWLWPARPICDQCQSMVLEWNAVNHTGRIVSWIVTHHVLLPAFERDSPYTVALVALDVRPDILIPGWFLGSQLRAPSGGMPVRAVFERFTESIGLMHWQAL